MGESVRVLGVRKLRGAKAGLAGRVPELEEALRGIVAGARGGGSGRGGGGGRPESVSASEGTTAVGREPRAMAVSRPRLSAPSNLGLFPFGLKFLERIQLVSSGFKFNRIRPKYGGTAGLANR